MKKALIALILFFVLCIPAFAADDGNFNGQFGINAGAYFFNNDALDDNGFFGGVEYKADMWSVALDYTRVDVVGEGDAEQLLFAHLDYLYYFNMNSMDAYDDTAQNPAYIGAGYTHRFQGDVVKDKGGFNVVVGMDWEKNWNFEGKYIYFGSDDTVWGISVGYFFD